MAPRQRLAMLLAWMMVVLAGCSFGSHATPAAHPQPSGPAGEIRIGIRQPSTLDPALRANPSDLLVAEQIFEPLVGFDPKTSALVPRLASRWDTEDGGSRFVFHLRPDATFQNGVTVTAGDVAFSLDRLALKSTASPLAYLLSPVEGFDAVNVSGTATTLAGVSVIDDHTLQITLSAPWMDFPYVLTDPATAPFPEAAYQADPSGFMQHPIGSGPYELEASSSLKSPVLQRYPGYWGPKPPVSVVDFVVNPPPAEVVSGLTDGTLDIGEVPPPNAASAEQDFGSSGFTPLAAGIYLGFNLADSSLGTLPLREAISEAVNRPAIAAEVTQDVLDPADGIVPAGVEGQVPLACGATCTYAPAQAKALVQQAFPQGVPPIALDYPAGEPNQEVAATIATDLAAVGVTATLTPQAPAEYLATLDANTQQMFLLVWVADYPLADWFLTPLFGSGSLDNHTGYQDSSVQAMLAQARTTTTATDRLALYAGVEHSVLADMAMSPIAFFRNHYAAASRVKGFYVDALGGFQVAALRLGP